MNAQQKSILMEAQKYVDFMSSTGITFIYQQQQNILQLDDLMGIQLLQ
jgi:hypothetical protein